jgi:hypothetical protein
MGGIAAARFLWLMEHGGIQIQTTRLHAAWTLREGRGSLPGPATQCAWTHADLPSDLRHRQPLLPQGAGLLILPPGVESDAPAALRPPAAPSAYPDR